MQVVLAQRYLLICPTMHFVLGMGIELSKQYSHQFVALQQIRVQIKMRVEMLVFEVMQVQ